MPSKFIKTKPRLSIAIICFVCTGIGLVVTQVQANIQEQESIALNNPHHIPDALNPKLQRLEEKAQFIKEEIKEEISEATETIHSLAFKENKASPRPIYDYTTGSSN